MLLRTLLTICILTISGISFGKTHPRKVKKATTYAHAKNHKGSLNIGADIKIAIKAINTGDVCPGDLIDFAKSNIGIPYLYASTNPDRGFDCSGFVTYVFNHFGIDVPRGSADYAGVQHPVALEDAQPGDLVLFTGTKTHHRYSIGHMGIIVDAHADSVEFIHATSGKENGVTITPLNARYIARLVKIIRVFPDAVAE